MDDELSKLLKYLQGKSYRILMVEGPRGSGKSTLINNLLSHTNMVYYKTWGPDQKNVRHELIDLGLDLPQATYFVLDLLTQVETTKPILADRGNLSAIAYQRQQYLFGCPEELHKYYVGLMKQVHAAILYLDVDSEVLIDRRVGRKDEDEFHLHKEPIARVEREVGLDLIFYEDAVALMKKLGCTVSDPYEIAEGACCYVIAPKED